MAYGARLESVLGASPRGFESPILRRDPKPCLPVPDAGDRASSCAQLTALRTSSRIRFSAFAVISITAKDTGHISPSSRFAGSSNDTVP